MRTGAFFFVLLVACQATETGQESFVAHRGTFAEDTATVEPGGVELEFGARTDTVRDTIDTPLGFKYGAGERTELLGGVPARAGGPGDKGFGDLVVGAKHRFIDQNDWPSLALVFATKLPTGAESQSSGQIDFGSGVSVTKDFRLLAATAYYELGVIGDPAGGTDLEHSVAVLGEFTLAARWGLFGEAVGRFAPTTDSEQWLANVGIAFGATEWLSFDVGATIGLNDEASDLELFAGFTLGLGGTPVTHTH